MVDLDMVDLDMVDLAMVDLAMVDQGFRNLWWIYRLVVVQFENQETNLNLKIPHIRSKLPHA